MIAVLVLGGVVWYAATTSLSSSTDSVAPAATVSAPKKLQIGDVGVLNGPGADAPAYLFADRPSFDEFAKAVRAKDLTGANLALTVATVVASGARAREIESDFWNGAVRVRVEDEPHAGFAGWTMSGDLHVAP